MLYLLLLLIVVVWLAIVVDRRLLTRRQLKVAGKERKLQQFRSWSQAALGGDDALQKWLAALSDDALLALAEGLSHYCHDLGIQFDWLVDCKVALPPTLGVRVQALAIQYVQACHAAYQMQDDIRSFETSLQPS